MITQILLYVGASFILLGAIGLFRFPDFYTRVHAVTMISIGGVCLSLFALAVSQFYTQYTIKIIVVIGLILITSPTAAHAIARAAYEKDIKPKIVRNEMES